MSQRRVVLTAVPVPSATTRIAAVIGDPIAHSLSPRIHNAGFAAAGLDWAYVAFRVPAGRGAEAVAAMRTLGIAGMSVTMPHKEAVAAACDRLTPIAAALGAVNCVALEGDEVVGDNTDGGGCCWALDQAGANLDGAPVVVLGAGGAARSVVAALGARGAEVTVVARRPDAARRAAALSPSGRVGTPDAVRAAAVVINATPVGMAQHPGMPCDPQRLHSGQLVMDLIYHPARTPWLDAAATRGALTLNGVGMLLGQALAQFERWTGVGAPVDAMAAALDQHLGWLPG